MIVQAGSVTDVGKVRASNQDCLVAEDGLFAVADGVGGHRGGEVASQTAVEALKAAFTERTTSGLVEAVRNANHAVYERSQQDDHLRGMGTTMTAVALVEEDGEERLAVVNVGDSRAYLLQQGELSQLTEDHSLVEELVRAGRLSPEDAIDHPQRSMITRALGLEPDVEVDSWQLLPFAGDRVLLCSDGLTNEVRDDRIASVLRRVDDPQAAAAQLVDEAKANGGNDNISVIVIDVVDDEGRAESASDALAGEPARTGGPRTEERAEAEAEPPPAPPEPAAKPAAEPARRRRRLTLRVALFVVGVLAVIVAAIAAVGWYARGSYYVGLRNDCVTVYRGRPGGLLWFDPTVESRTRLCDGDIPRSRLDDLRSGKEVADRAEARRYVDNLRDESNRRVATTPTVTSSP